MVFSALFSQSPMHAAVLNSVECLATQKWLLPFGGSLSVLFKCVQVVRRGVAWP